MQAAYWHHGAVVCGHLRIPPRRTHRRAHTSGNACQANAHTGHTLLPETNACALAFLPRASYWHAAHANSFAQHYARNLFAAHTLFLAFSFAISLRKTRLLNRPRGHAVADILSPAVSPRAFFCYQRTRIMDCGGWRSFIGVGRRA